MSHARPKLLIKWTVASSGKHGASRQQGVVTLKRLLVQSRWLLPPREDRVTEGGMHELSLREGTGRGVHESLTS